MVRITAFIRPYRLEEVKSALVQIGVSGLSVSDVRGCGNSPEKSSVLAGNERIIALPVRAKLVTVVADELREAVIETILESARTDEPGDGKIFAEEVRDAIRIRTNEHGDPAL